VFHQVMKRSHPIFHPLLRTGVPDRRSASASVDVAPHNTKWKPVLIAWMTTLITLAGCGPPGGGAIRLDGDLKQLRTRYEGAVRSKPSDAHAHAQLGAVLIQEGRSDNALRHLKRAIKLAPNNTDYYRWYAKALLKSGRLHQAHAAHELLLKKKPSWKTTYERDVLPQWLSLMTRRIRIRPSRRDFDLVKRLDKSVFRRPVR